MPDIFTACCPITSTIFTGIAPIEDWSRIVRSHARSILRAKARSSPSLCWEDCTTATLAKPPDAAPWPFIRRGASVPQLEPKPGQEKRPQPAPVPSPDPPTDEAGKRTTFFIHGVRIRLIKLGYWIFRYPRRSELPEPSAAGEVGLQGHSIQVMLMAYSSY